VRKAKSAAKQRLLEGLRDTPWLFHPEAILSIAVKLKRAGWQSWELVEGMEGWETKSVERGDG
jgi:hypothetical protein